MHLAVKAGHRNIVEKLLAAGCSGNEKDNDRRTPLHEAFLSDRGDIALYLINSGKCNLDVLDKQKRSPLFLAAQSGDLDSFRVLFSGCTLPQSFRHAIHAACAGGNLKIVTMLLNLSETHPMLLDRDASPVNERQETGETPLHVACSSRHKEVVKRLLERGADYNAESSKTVNVPLGREADYLVQSSFGKTPLHIASENGDVEIVNLLLLSGASIVVPDSLEDTPLHSAIDNGHVEVVVRLLDHAHDAADVDLGVIINAPGSGGFTPLHLAVLRGHVHLAKLCLDRGANVHATDGLLGYTPMHHVCSYESQFSAMEILQNMRVLAKLLLLHDLDRSTALDTSLDRSTPLMLASNNGHKKLVKLILKYAPGSVMDRDKNGLSALHYTCMNTDAKKYRASARILLENKAEVNARDNEGNTPLHATTARRNHKLTLLLEDNGANRDTQNNIGHTPLDIINGRTTTPIYLEA